MIHSSSSYRFARVFIVAALGAGAAAAFAVGCSSSSTSGGGGTDAATDSPTADANNPTTDGSMDTDSGNDDGGQTDAGSVTTEFKVDGKVCTFANLTVETKLSGGSDWRVMADLTCPVIGASSVIVIGEDNKTYPEVCALDSLDAAKEPYTIELNVNSESDGGYNYESNYDNGSCSITAGPTSSALNAPIIASATVSNGAGGTTHQVVVTISERPK